MLQFGFSDEDVLGQLDYFLVKYQNISENVKRFFNSYQADFRPDPKRLR